MVEKGKLVVKRERPWELHLKLRERNQKTVFRWFLCGGEGTSVFVGVNKVSNHYRKVLYSVRIIYSKFHCEPNGAKK